VAAAGFLKVSVVLSPLYRCADNRVHRNCYNELSNVAVRSLFLSYTERHKNM
jgi:hypothetical protein